MFEEVVEEEGFEEEVEEDVTGETAPSKEVTGDYEISVERDAALVQEALGPFGSIIENINLNY